MEAQGVLTRTGIIAELVRSPHGKLEAFAPVARMAASTDPEFLAHLIAWNAGNGQVRDSKVALPVLSLAVESFPQEFVENSLAHLANLDPRNLVRAIRFGKTQKTPKHGRAIARTVTQYLRAREENWAWWERAAVQHRRSMKELYALFHVKPTALAEAVLFKGEKPRGTLFEAVARLQDMVDDVAVRRILQPVDPERQERLSSGGSRS
jgi:hypothetical protein